MINSFFKLPTLFGYRFWSKFIDNFMNDKTKFRLKFLFHFSSSSVFTQGTGFISVFLNLLDPDPKRIRSKDYVVRIQLMDKLEVAGYLKIKPNI